MRSTEQGRKQENRSIFSKVPSLQMCRHSETSYPFHPIPALQALRLHQPDRLAKLLEPISECCLQFHIAHDKVEIFRPHRFAFSAGFVSQFHPEHLERIKDMGQSISLSPISHTFCNDIESRTRGVHEERLPGRQTQGKNIEHVQQFGSDSAFGFRELHNNGT